jgi:hypothetical protein
MVVALRTCTGNITFTNGDTAMKIIRILIAAGILLAGTSIFASGAEDVQKQIDDIKGVLPKIAIPMREVGDRFQNMYFAAEKKNWGLAYYMSKYMFGAMKPASLTKPKEYPGWKAFYDEKFTPVNKAIEAEDFAAFEKAYTAVIKSCNECHVDSGYKFVKVVKMSTPADNGIDYTVPSKASDVPQ